MTFKISIMNVIDCFAKLNYFHILRMQNLGTIPPGGRCRPSMLLEYFRK
ncbi:MAG: hypothetical protein ACI8PB_005183, partial [Desulforhopalus sp.]